MNGNLNPPSRPLPARSLRSRVRHAVRDFSFLHAPLQAGYRIGRLLFAQWPLTIYYRWCNLVSRRPGVEPGRAEPVIVSLTSFGPRLRVAIVCIETLMRQTVRPDRIILWLAHGEDTAPIAASLRQLEARGLEVRRCEDWRSYKKIIPTIAEFPHAAIVTADDDVFYPRRWLEKLLDAYRLDQSVIHCHRSHRIALGPDGRLARYVDWPSGVFSAGVASAWIFPTGVGGVLYPPGSLDARVLDHGLFRELCYRNDDIWLKAMSLLAGVPCRQTTDFPRRYLEVPDSQGESLWHTNVAAGGNDEQLRRTFDHFDLLKRLKETDDAGGVAAPRVAWAG